MKSAYLIEEHTELDVRITTNLMSFVNAEMRAV
jgi:hypothetical protein